MAAWHSKCVLYSREPTFHKAQRERCCKTVTVVLGHTTENGTGSTGRKDCGGNKDTAGSLVGKKLVILLW